MRTRESLPMPGRCAGLIAAAICLLLLTACDQEPEVDATPPARVTDLAVTDSTGVTLTVCWTATGDDDISGRAALYDVRYSASALGDFTWAAAAQVRGEPEPLDPGSFACVVIGGLEPGTTYQVGLKARDESCNWSELSNVIAATTIAREAWLKVPWVRDGLESDEQWSRSGSALSASWGCAPGAAWYEYAIGTEPGATDTRHWTGVSLATRIDGTGLTLGHGVTYYFSVRAGSDLGYGPTAHSDGVTVDLEPPDSRVEDLQVTRNGPVFTVYWSGTDDISGINSYDIQYRAGGSGQWTDWVAGDRGPGLEFNAGRGRATYFRSRARDAAGNLEPYPAVADAFTFVYGAGGGAQGPKFALHLVSHGEAGCGHRPDIRWLDDVVRCRSGLTDLDAFLVIFDYDSLSVYEYSLDWPSEWGSCSTVVCDGPICVGQLHATGDPGIACYAGGCITETASHFALVAYHWFVPTCPGVIEIQPQRGSGNIGVVDCRSEDDPTKCEHYAAWVDCGCVGVHP